MRFTRSLLMAATLSLAIVTPLVAQTKAAPATGEGIRFHQGTWTSLLAEAKKQNKPIFVDVYAVWCGPCKYMSKVTFQDATVGRFANQNFVSYKLDAEEGEGVKLAEKFDIRGYPTYVFLSPDGTLIGKEESGAMDAPDFLRVLQAFGEKAKRRAEGKSMKMATPQEKAALGVLFQKQN